MKRTIAIRMNEQKVLEAKKAANPMRGRFSKPLFIFQECNLVGPGVSDIGFGRGIGQHEADKISSSAMALPRLSGIQS